MFVSERETGRAEEIPTDRRAVDSNSSSSGSLSCGALGSGERERKKNQECSKLSLTCWPLATESIIHTPRNALENAFSSLSREKEALKEG